MKEENRLYQRLRTLIRKKNKEMMSEFKKLDRVPSSDAEIRVLIAPLTEAIIEYNDIIMENTQESIQAGMERTKTELKKQGLGKSFESDMRFILNGSLKTFPITDIDFEEFSQEVSDRMKHDTFIASQGTIDRMSGDVMNNIKDSYEQGYGIDKAAVNLQGAFDDMEEWELKRVARTEINGAQNLGAEATMRQLGIVYDKWKTAGDARVRGNRPEDAADHKYMDGQISYVSGNFSNGLSRPGDRSGPIKEWIQCRCDLIPYLMPEGYAAPSGTFFYESDLVKIEIPEPGVRPKPGTKPKPGLKPKPKPRLKPQYKDPVKIREELTMDMKDYRARSAILDQRRQEMWDDWEKRYGKMPSVDSPEYEIWKIGADKATRESSALIDESIRQNKLIRQKFKEQLIINKEGFKITSEIGSEFSKEGVRNARRGIREFSRYVDKGVLPKDPAVFVKYIPANGRAHQTGMKIAITDREAKRVIVHEMGHYLENWSPGMQAKTRAFYEMRTARSKAVHLGRGFRPDEFTKKDKFIDKYMGKVYSKDTELLSMGLEYFYNDPVQLASRDPEMFDFIYNLVRGII